jgi:hypothetical protein
MKVKHIFFSATLAQTFNIRCFRIDWCGNYCPSPRRTFHSSRRSGSVLVLFATEKELSPRGYEREEIMNH